MHVMFVRWSPGCFAFPSWKVFFSFPSSMWPPFHPVHTLCSHVTMAVTCMHTRACCCFLSHALVGFFGNRIAGGWKGQGSLVCFSLGGVFSSYLLAGMCALVGLLFGVHTRRALIMHTCSLAFPPTVDIVPAGICLQGGLSRNSFVEPCHPSLLLVSSISEQGRGRRTFCLPDYVLHWSPHEEDIPC